MTTRMLGVPLCLARRPPAGLALAMPYGLDKRNEQFVVCFMLARFVLLIKYLLGP